MNLLTTKCSWCVFNKSEKGEGCYLDKDVITINGEQHLEGYCKFKRDDKWTGKGLKQEKIDQIISEENSLSCIILVQDRDLQNFTKTIESIKYDIQQIVVNIIDSDKNFTNAICNIIKTAKVKWKINDIKSADSEVKLTDLYLVDRCMTYCDNRWFLTLYSGDEVSLKIFTFWNFFINSKYNNEFCLYFDENDPIRMFINKSCFVELCGNMDLTFIDKVRTFENGKKLCLKLL